MKTYFYQNLLTPILLLISLFGVTSAKAHKVASASMILYLDTEKERTFQVSVQMEVESSGDAALDDEIGPEEAARTFVENQLMVLIDEKEQPHDISTEMINQSDADTPIELQRYSVLVTWDGKLPDNGKELALYLKETSEMSIVIATVKNEIPGRRLQVMFAGEYSRAENIEPLVKGNPFDEPKVGEANKGEKAVPKAGPPVPDNQASSVLADQMKAGAVATFHNMFLPLCLLFALVLLKGSFRALILPFVIFLVAHSVGISLTALGVIPVLSWAPTVCMAALLVLAIDNLFSFKFRVWRYLAGGIGGFFLGNEIVRSGAFPPTLPVEVKALIPFQIGFDITIFIAVVVLGGLIALFGRFSYFRSAFVIPFSILLAGVAVFHLLVGNEDIEKLIGIASRFYEGSSLLGYIF